MTLAVWNKSDSAIHGQIVDKLRSVNPDTIAYLEGVAIHRARIYERIDPKLAIARLYELLSDKNSYVNKNWDARTVFSSIYLQLCGQIQLRGLREAEIQLAMTLYYRKIEFFSGFYRVFSPRLPRRGANWDSARREAVPAAPDYQVLLVTNRKFAISLLQPFEARFHKDVQAVVAELKVAKSGQDVSDAHSRSENLHKTMTPLKFIACLDANGGTKGFSDELIDSWLKDLRRLGLDGRYRLVELAVERYKRRRAGPSVK